MKNFQLEFTKKFIRKYKKLINGNPDLKEVIDEILCKLNDDPKNRSLGTHKVRTSEFGLVFSSVVTGDLRIIWQFSGNKLIIFVLDIGGHSGKHGVYK